MITGCSSTEEKDKDLIDQVPAEQPSMSTDGYSEDPLMAGEEFENQSLEEFDEFGTKHLGPEFRDPNNPLSKNKIYFMYDSSQIKQSFIPVIAAHSKYLREHPSQRIILEGHADERGSREYNIALGEQRAKAVYRMMKMQGVAGSQLEIVSYGEEKPDAEGMDESSWQLNRRSVIVYQGN